MNKLLLGCFLLLSPILLFAHNPLSAKYYLEHNDQGTFVNIYLSQDGVNQAMLQQYGRDVLQQQDQTAFKQLIVDHIKNNFELKVDGQVVTLLEGGIKLGNHQTDLKFLLDPLPKEVNQLEISIPAFKENAHHQTIFSYNIYNTIDKVILSEQNNFQATVLLKEGGTYYSPWLYVLGGLVLLSLIGGLWIIRKKKQRLV